MKAMDLMPLFWILLTLSTYLLFKGLHKRLKWLVTTPMVGTVAVLMAVVLVSQVDFAAYDEGARYISFFLEPAVVPLGVLFYETFAKVGQNFKPFLLPTVLGGLGDLLSVIIIL